MVFCSYIVHLLLPLGLQISCKPLWFKGVFFFIAKRKVDLSLAWYFVLETVISVLPLLAVLPLLLPPFHIQVV